MKAAIKVILISLSFLLIQSLSSCFKEAVNLQVEMQELLISPQESGKCWTLIRRSEKEEYQYFRKWYEFKMKYLNEDVHAIDFKITKFYTDAEVNYTRMYQDYRDHHKIDLDMTDCNDVPETDSVFFRTTNYPNFKKATIHEFTYPEYKVKVSNAPNPGFTRDSFYYYEELYFERSGRFKKKIFLDTGCNAIEIMGNWVFRTPFANYSGTDLILRYDQLPTSDLPPKSDIYQIVFEDDDLVISQNVSKTDSSAPIVRANYAIKGDKIYHSSDTDPYDSIHGEKIKGMVTNHWSDICAYAVEKPDDMVEVYDPIEILEKIVQTSRSRYTMAPIRCNGNSSSNPNCPKYCGMDICANFNASVYDTDNQPLSQGHKSDMSITADSSMVTITNFANIGQALSFKMPKYSWHSCYNFDEVTTVLDGNNVKLTGFLVETFKGKRMLLVECTINGAMRKIRYVVI